MKYLLLLFAFGTINCLYSQDTTFTVEDFNIKIENSRLSVDEQGKRIFGKNFSDPFCFTVDLDNDGTDELLINDSEEKNGLNYYTLYIFNCAGSFSLTDSIYSGLKEPYILNSDEVDNEEINNIVIVTGSPDFDSLYVPELETAFSPLVCWSFVDTALTIVNDQLYNVFISENEKNIEVIDAIYNEKGRNCKTTGLLKSVIASTFANYMYADEKAMADRALVQFYFCDDLEEFKESIKKLL